MKFRLVENFDGYKKGDKVELSNGQTGTVVSDQQLDDDRITVSIDGIDETKYPLVDTVRPVYSMLNDVDESLNESISKKEPAKIGIFEKNKNKVLQTLDPNHRLFQDLEKRFIDIVKRLDSKKFDVCEYTVDRKGNIVKGQIIDKYNNLLDTNAKEEAEKSKAETKKQPQYTRDPKTGARIYRDIVDSDDAFDALMQESFSKEFESRELLDTGELISALKALVKEYGHMELEKEVYLETVDNDHGRQLKIGYQQINEDADPELNKKIANIRQQALEYVLDRLSDFYMPEYDQEERIKHANNIVDMIVRIYPEMTDYVQYWGAGETEIDKLWHEGVREDVTDELYNNFPESVITDYLYAKKILRDD